MNEFVGDVVLDADQIRDGLQSVAERLNAASKGRSW